MSTLDHTPSPSLRQRLALHGIDGVTLLVLPAALFTLAIFVYPFVYGLLLSFQPKEGGSSPTTSVSSPTRSFTTPLPQRCGWRCRSPLSAWRWRCPSPFAFA